MDKSGYTDAMQATLDRLSDVFDETSIQGIHQAFLDIRSTLENQHDPSKVHDPIFEAELRSRMQTLTNLLNDAYRQVEEAEKVEYSKLDGRGTNEQGSVEQINEILRKIGGLNRQIKQNQIFGQQSLELMDERNLLLDKLSSYIPIEVTYYKDINYDGNDDGIIYDYDSKGNIIGKRDWPDDLRVEMVYQDKDGNTQKLTLVEGTIGSKDDNYGSVAFANDRDYLDDPSKTSLTFKGFERDTNGNLIPNKQSITFDSPVFTPGANGTTAEVGNHFADGSGSIQSSLDMLWKDGITEGITDKRGYGYYKAELDTLAKSFAEVINGINAQGTQQGDASVLLVNKTDDSDNGISAKNIGISLGWQGGTTHIGTSTDRNPDMNATVLNLLEAMKATYPTDSFLDPGGNKLFDDVDLKDNSFADYMNHVSTILANDSYRNATNLKTNVTVLNGIQNSRDSVSCVSLDEEASNMMMYMSAYNASSRLMTTLDQALDVLINSTGVVGR